uniref:RNA-dependent RNA polymerase n=1 Tax=Picoa juniperi partitivirus 2 TaxID=2778513 RepID=A0A7L8Y987_9VIRU|nr:RNA-dependent RNA polymerase [Picoa juniperi partitivirus 2]
MLSISNIVTIFVLLRFQHRRRSKQTLNVPSYPVRNVTYEWYLRLAIPRNTPISETAIDYSRTLLAYIDLHTCYQLMITLDARKAKILERYTRINEPFALYQPIDPSSFPNDRLPSPGLRILPFRFHSIPAGFTLPEQGIEQPTYHDPNSPTLDLDTDLSGAPANQDIVKIIHEWFPFFEQFVDKYCRPPSYGPQAFIDFNKPTELISDPSPERENDILTVINSTFAIKPYRPLHFVDAQAAMTPLSTSAAYHDKFDPETLVISRKATPQIYAARQMSKGHHNNVMLNTFRLELHNIKVDLPSRDDLIHFFLKHPTQLFIRSQISLRDPQEPKKIRPVYAVDSRFLHIEKMLTTNFLAQMRNPECCVLHGLETFRGSMQFIDQIAHSFNFYVSLDWSSFDQRLPLSAIKCYYTRVLPSLLIISDGYFPSRGYENTAQPIDHFARKVFNILSFLYTWYRNMVFLSFDGYAYTRLNGGVPSGLLNTQSLDSFGNMYVLADCLLEFGFTTTETQGMIFFILGDDNIFFVNQPHARMIDFMDFLDTYALKRHGMVLSVLKSVYSKLRTQISILGYTNMYGMPIRPLGKLVAQLVYPERPVPEDKQWMHAARALGLAYAACGQDSSFHQLCFHVYRHFKPDYPVPSSQFRKWIKFTVREIINFETDAELTTFPEFPSLQEIRSLVSTYHGPFSETDKWPETLFEDTPPSDNLHTYTTLDEWLRTHPEFQFDSENYMPGYDAPDALSIAFSNLQI